jgi:prepilin-type N-terminal cleavage/methylation domain-containing protein/prepilin-type processing-associated H-X9-DG protein
MQTMRTSSKHAFTLTELLVVIAIIGILAALLFPTLTRGKQKAQQTQCASNVKQLGIAIHMYAVDNSDTLPGPAWQGLYYTYNTDADRFLYYIATYLSAPGPSSILQTNLVATCPSSLPLCHEQPGAPQDSLTRPLCYLLSTEVTNTVTGIVTRPFGYPYASKNYRLPPGPNELPKKVQDILSPSTSWAITDADQQNAFPGGLYFNLIPVTPVHGIYRNALFFDWHVEEVKAN